MSAPATVCLDCRDWQRAYEEAQRTIDRMALRLGELEDEVTRARAAEQTAKRALVRARVQMQHVIETIDGAGSAKE